MSDKARVDVLLKNFDPNSYEFSYHYTDRSGKLQKVNAGKAKGLAALRQSRTVRAKGELASTNTIINLFKSASTNTVINIFKEAASALERPEVASTNTIINIFKEARLNSRASELNTILAKYYDGKARPGQQLKPLSSRDGARVTALLKNFDPNSYDISFSQVARSGKPTVAQLGGAKGLAQLRQTNTVRAFGDRASTNTIINIFKAASTNTTINIFKTAATALGKGETASTNTIINIFKEDRLNSAATELNSILKKYSAEQ